ncbi:MAG: CRISPR-associated RAMP protein Csx7 [Acidobacteriota bacterium]|nr:CRISPR-associated RAMP protein Csx7 [Acidobacteriota bacterium]
MTFDKFTSRVTIRGQIIAETGLHIGSGASSLDPSASDSPVIRDGGGRPFIPGSSFKGALRAHLESLVRGAGRTNFQSCDPLAAPCINPDDIKQIKEDAEKDAETEAKAQGDERLKRVIQDQLLTNRIINRTCVVCQLFGSPWLASHAMIKDLFVAPDWWAGKIERRDGVGIDRDTETARQGVKYDFDVVPASTRFDLEIIAENADDDLLGLLAIGLRDMERQRVSLGGKTSRGLGGVKLKLNEVEVVGDDAAEAFDGDGKVDLLNYLIEGKGRLLKDTAAESYLGSKVKELAKARLK